MRVVTWNCAKRSPEIVVPIIESLQPDVLVLTEGAQSMADPLGCADLSRSAWTGDDPRAGLGVYTFNGYLLNPLVESPPHPDLDEDPRARTERLRRWTLPVEVGGPHSFFLLAVWAHNEWVFRPLNAAIEDYSDRLAGPSIVAGDFNNGCRWDGETGNPKDHRHTVSLLGALGLVSTYHQARGLTEHHGRTDIDQPSHWSGYDADRPYLIDFIYAPVDWIVADPDTVTIGSWDEYAKPTKRISDHAPVIADLEPSPA